VDAERIQVIHSAVEPPARLPSAAERRAARARWGLGGEAVVGTVAALERRKGHDVLLRALGPLREAMPRIRCLVCGGGSERVSLERLAKELGVDPVVRFLGEQREVTDVLAALDVFVLPSRHEGLGVALLEAMAAGLPVVASHVGGIPETVQAGHTGLLVPAEDPGALGAAIGDLLKNRDRAARMGAEGRRRVLFEFSMEGLADRYEALYASLTAPVAGTAVRGLPDG
jgi:glycosyltransferase involved in cell wall biosynthesis